MSQTGFNNGRGLRDEDRFRRSPQKGWSLMRARVRSLGVLAALCAVAAVLTLSVGTASAKVYHPYVGSLGTSTFTHTVSIAVDQKTEDVYVYDYYKGKIYKFDAAGNAVNYSSTGTNAISLTSGPETPEEAQIAVDSSSGPASGDIYFVTKGTVIIYNSAGEKIGELTEQAGVPWGHYICGVAVDPSGSVYVGIYEGYVNKYTPTANPVTNANYQSSLSGLYEPCGVAVDGAGNVYTEAWGGEGGVTRYSPLQFGVFPSSGNLVDPHGHSPGVDPGTNEVYIDEQKRVSQFGPHGEPFGEPRYVFGETGEGALHGGTSFGIAINEKTRYVYVGAGFFEPVEVFAPAQNYPEASTGVASEAQPNELTLNGTVNPEGEPIEECLFEYGETAAYGNTVPCAETATEVGHGSNPVSVHAKINGLSVGTTYHFRVVAVAKHVPIHGKDGTASTPNTPLVQGTSVISVRGSSATVTAEIDPRYGLTKYRFEYGATSGYGASVPVPDGSAGSGNEYIAVTAGPTGLQPGMTYHFRIVATNAVGTVQGPDLTFTTYGTEMPVQESCPNAGVRTLQGSGYLPDCRAYEMVSPNDKNGGNVSATPTMTQAAVNGNAIKFTSTTAFGDALGGEVRGAEYISVRGMEGWATHGVNPRQASTPNVTVGPSQMYEYFSPNLEQGVYYALSPVLGGFPNVEKNANLYLRTDALAAGAGSYRLLSDASERQTPRSGETYNWEIAFAGASADMKHIVFESLNDLTENSQGLNLAEPKLYEWQNGIVSLVGILPNHAPAAASVAGPSNGVGANPLGGWTESTISADGSRVIFTGPPFASRAVRSGTLYMRIEGKETVQINESERTDCNIERKEAEPAYKCTGAPELDPNGAQSARFWYASEDGSKVFFTTQQALTDDTSVLGVANLYMYDLEAPAGKRLTLISQDSHEAPSGGRQPALMVAGISNNGSYVYFTSAVSLQAGDPTPGASYGQLYVWHEGTLRFVATRDKEGCFFDGTCWGDNERESGDVFRVNPAGTTVAFTSDSLVLAEQFGITMPEASGQGAYHEAYVYNYNSGKLSCASCNRLGLPAAATATFGADKYDQQSTFILWGAELTMYRNRPLSENGRYLFFDTGEALVPQDTNGQRDVYEYDTVSGQVHLLTSGTCACESAFVDASPDGNNVFVVTHAKLVASDEGSSGDLYDVRVGGGFTAQSEAPAPPCIGEECQPPGSPSPQLLTPSSATFAGAGNQVQAALSPGAVKRRITRSRQLAKALKACTKRPPKQRAKCRVRAQRRYGTRSATARKARSSKRRHGGRS